MQHQHDPSPLICSGSWEGDIAWIPQGDNGFGYDPIFLVPERGKTAAQLSADEKNQLSHRGKALKQLREQLQTVTTHH
jgi:XTP/dITP diphosphohydrolase